MAISKLDTITGRMSKLMLRRWPMLAEQCPESGCNAPLMRDPESGSTKCVWHDARELFPDELTELEALPMVPLHDRRKDDEKLSPKSNHGDDDDTTTVSATIADKSVDQDTLQTEESKAASLASLARQRKREQSDLASQRIAKRLLQGWAMIDQACPNESCYSVPLVQDREKTQLCVVCGQHYMDEDAYAKKFGALAPATTPSSSNSHPAPENKPLARQVLADLPTPVTAATASSDKTAARSPDVEARPAKRRHRSAAVGVAVKALEDKLAKLSAQLAEATDCRDICSISKAIGACARAIHECQAPKQQN
ncbi:hypothetical protein GGI19_003797 [Coemansia pectinata]|uniref:Uncharacterized protein n=1 Tax=Coemansia pectinata TaxID=1052879 RepID=A0A9W8GXA1_9FUNG|nr:hypothetical protein GGI19_003797 [Coemansia pectinata]